MWEGRKRLKSERTTHPEEHDESYDKVSRRERLYGWLTRANRHADKGLQAEKMPKQKSALCLKTDERCSNLGAAQRFASAHYI